MSVAFDVDPEQARQTRECLLRQAASEQWLIAGMHLGLPGFASGGGDALWLSVAVGVKVAEVSPACPQGQAGLYVRGWAGR